jgi:hypothetical protein
MDFNAFFNNPTNRLILVILALWSLAWKGVALWRAARNNQRNWFVAMLIINTFGIIEIIYLFYLSKPSVSQKPESDDSSRP